MQQVMSHVSSMGVGFVLVCAYPLPWISRIMIPSSHPHRPHGSSLSMETFGNPAIMGNPDFPRRSAFHLRSSSPFLIHRHRLSASYKIGVVSTDQLLVRPFFAYGKPDLRGFSDFRLHSQRRRFVPQTSPAGPPFTRVLQVLFVHPHKSPASRHRLLSLRNHLRSGPADPPEQFSQGPCPPSQSCLQVHLCPLN